MVTVWNILKSKCKGSAVRVERGLMESSDVVLIRDMKLYILTDRGMASFTDTPRPIFQVQRPINFLLLYNLILLLHNSKGFVVKVNMPPLHSVDIHSDAFL